MTFPLRPPPDAVTRAGPVRAALSAVAALIRAERRLTLDVRTDALRVDPSGLLRVGSMPGLAFEEHGLRTFLGYYTDAFPRACPYLLTLPGPVAAPLFAHSLRSTPGLAAEVRLRIRGTGDGAVFAAVPTSYAPYDVDAVLRDVPHLEPDALAYVVYDAVASSVTAVIYPPGGGMGLQVNASDDYAGGVRVSVLDVDATPDGPVVRADYGDPLPTVQRRKRGSMGPEGMAPLLAAKFAAAAEWYAFKARIPALARELGYTRDASKPTP